MGFRCPKCHKDMGKNKYYLDAHMKLCTGVSLAAFENLDIGTVAQEQSQVMLIESTILKDVKKTKDGEQR